MEDEFLARYPAFKIVDPLRIRLALNDAQTQLDKKIWNRLYEQGLYALTAHILYMEGALTKSGSTDGKPMQTATSKSAGALSVSYTAPDAGFGTDHKGLAMSTYGQEYLRLRRLVRVHVLVIR